jgi:hypothetical protein
MVIVNNNIENARKLRANAALYQKEKPLSNTMQRKLSQFLDEVGGNALRRSSPIVKNTVWEVNHNNAQSYWNSLERNMVIIFNELAPCVPFKHNSVKIPEQLRIMKNKLYYLRCLLINSKTSPSHQLRDNVRSVNQEIIC